MRLKNPTNIPPKYFEFLSQPYVAMLATVNENGFPQLTPIWFDFDKETGMFSFNTAPGRKKFNNVLKNNRVALAILNPNDPYEYVSVQGEVVDQINDQEISVPHIDKLAKRYMNREVYPLPEGEKRIIFMIKPLYIHGL